MDQCRLATEPAGHRDTLIVALTGPVDLAHLHDPTNDSERLLFRQFAPTLVGLDCQGKVRPELAESWRSDPDGKGWTFTLGERTRFSEGTSLTALHVVSALRLPRARALGIDSAVPLDDRRLHVRIREAGDTAPRLFANPDLAIPDSLVAEPGWSRIELAPSAGRPAIAFQAAGGGDARDALDRGADLMVTRDPEVVDYAANRPEFATFPLPWDRTYILLQPAGAQGLPIAHDSVRRSLARDAVRAEARPAMPPFWWDRLSACGVASQAEGQMADRVVYPRNDEVARGLAERVVALAGARASLRAAPMDPAELAAVLREGAERAVVIAVPRESLSPCQDSSGWPAGASIQPLIDTRARAIVRRGSPELSVDWDGTVRLLPP